MDKFRQSLKVAPLYEGGAKVDLSVYGFDPTIDTESAVASRIVITARTGYADLQFYLSPAEARELAALLLTAGDTFDDGPTAGAYLVKYIAKAPAYPAQPIAPRDLGALQSEGATL